MSLRWTNADRKRAAKMGWFYKEDAKRILAWGYRTFRTDREAAEWVIKEAHYPHTGNMVDSKTALKAVLLCCLGGNQ